MDYKDESPSKEPTPLVTKIQYEPPPEEIGPELAEDIENCVKKIQSMVDSQLPDAYLDYINTRFQLNSKLIGYVLYQINFIDIICKSLMTTPERSSDILRIKVLSLTISQVPDSVVEFQPYALQFVTLANERACFFECMHILSCILTNTPEKATELVNNHILRSLQQFITLMGTKKDRSYILNVLKIIVTNCDDEILRRNTSHAIPPIHTLMPNSTVQEICTILQMLQKITKINIIMPIHAIYTNPVTDYLFDCTRFPYLMNLHMSGVLQEIISQDVQFFIYLDNKYNAIGKLMDFEEKESQKEVEIGVLFLVIMKLSYYEEGIQHLIARELIVPLITLFPVLKFKYQIRFHYFTASASVYALRYMIDNTDFPLIINTMVEYLSNNFNDALFRRFVELMNNIISSAYIGIVQSFDLDELKDMLEDINMGDSEDDAIMAGNLLEVLFPSE